MQVSVDWLKQYASVKASAHEIAERLTMSVNEVDEVRSATALKDIVVAEVTSLERHPDADNLWIVKVSSGRNVHRIVTGADNLSVGAKVPLAQVGVTLPDGLKITKRTLRGVVSAGMLCSARELGAGEDHSGIWILPAGAPIGKPLSVALGGRVDSFDLDVSANRPDLMGHLGIAREVASAFGTTLKEPVLKTANRKRSGVFQPKISDSAQCVRFSLARIRGLQNGATPDWIKDRLVSVGLRPINAVVDITNFVMLETGQPLHAYDFSKLTGVMMYTRQAKAGETIKTLDGKTRNVPKGTLMIADRTQALGIAGIMGGTNSEVSVKSEDVVIECANFDSATIRRASRKLGLRTDASARFEKGLPADLVWPTIRRAIDLILEACGGELVQLSDSYPRKQRNKSVIITTEQLHGFLGESVPLPVTKRSLERLGFTVRPVRQKLAVTPPYWRTDIVNGSDLVEEVARTIGYDKLSSALPVAQLAVPSRPQLSKLRSMLQDTLAGLGATEIVTHSLVGEALLKRAGYPNQELVTMQNPLSADHQYLRRSMEPRHLESVTDNLRWRDDLRFFEIGRTFKQSSGKVIERNRLMVTIAGKRKTDTFSEIRGLLTVLGGTLKISQTAISYQATTEPQYLPERQFNIVSGRTVVGHVAEYASPKQWKAGSVAFLSLELDEWVKLLPQHWGVTQASAFPSVRRDLSLFLPEDATYAAVREVVIKSAGPLLRSVGDPEEFRKQGKRSLTVRLAFGSPKRTLTDTQVTEAMRKVEAAIVAHGWKIRE